jgi:hypothetical protein
MIRYFPIDPFPFEIKDKGGEKVSSDFPPPIKKFDAEYQ